MPARAIAAGWLRLAANYFLDDRVLSVSPMAELLWLRGLAYSKLNRLDGYIPYEALHFIGHKLGDTGALTDELLTAGLWVARGPGIGVPAEKWRDYQETKEQESDRRAKNAERQRKYAERRANGGTSTNGTGGTE
jgi:hypothetical protein